jgi:hypothetical protein
MRNADRLHASRFATVLVLALHGVAAPARIPEQAITAAGGGRIVYGTVAGASSQAVGLGAMLHSVHRQCGEKPKVSQVFRVRGTDSVAVFFNVVNHPGGNQPMAGMVLAARTADGIEAALLTDAANRFNASLNPMLQQLFGVWHPGAHGGGAAVPASGGASFPAARLHQVRAEDGSASVGVPDGWQAKGQMGTMLVSGPHGETIGLNLTRLAVDPRTRQGGSRAGQLVYPANTNLAKAFPDLFQQFWHLNGANPTGLHLDLAEPLPGMPAQRGAHVTGQVSLVPSEPADLDALVLTTPPSSMGSYLVMFSMALVPAALANQERATAGAILASFKPDQGVIARQAGAMAAPAIAAIHQIGAQAQARAASSSRAHDLQNQTWEQDQAAKAAQNRNWEQSQDAQERKTQGFSNYLLDQTVVLDNEQNAHGTFWNSTANAMVKANPDRYELVDTPDYWKGIDY